MRRKTPGEGEVLNMYVKINKSSDSGVVAVCDEDLIGKTLKGNSMELKVSEFFYKGEIKSEAEAIEIMKKAKNLNILGEKSIAAALKAGVITKENIVYVGGVPHAQAYAL